MRALPRLLCALAVLMLIAPAVHAQEPFTIVYQTTVKGRDKPAVVLTPAQSVKKLSIELTDDSGKKQRLKAGRMRANKPKRFTFRHGTGTATYAGRIEIHWGDGSTGLYAIEVSATRVGELKLNISAEDVDLDERRLACTATNPVKTVSLVLHGESGSVLDEIEESFADAVPSGDAISLEWPEQSEKIIRMDLRVVDIAGFYTGVRITPFTIEIPHEEVNFEFGRANIRPSEEPKLEATLGHIRDALAKHGTLLTLKLFVAGYTDTVGSPASNRELSNRRAKSIAGWFRANGLKVPIYYMGFGEEVLAVPTPDETEEARNRRALYILSSHVPSGEHVPSSKWHRL